MAKTLLNGVNELLKTVTIIAGDSAELASLTDSARQVYVDAAVRIWNEVLGEMYSTAELPMPSELAENTITLVTDDRDYALETDLVQLHWPFLDETNGDFIHKFRGEYLDLINTQPQPANFTGQPLFGVIRPTDGQLYLDRIPTSTENGRVYKYRYDKDLELTAFDDTVPFNDVVFRALVPACAQLWERDFKKTFDAQIFQTFVGQAARYMTEQQPRDSWRSYA